MLAFDEQGHVTDTRHLLENIETEWTDDKLHLQPIQQFVRDNFISHPAKRKAVIKSIFGKTG